MLCAFALCFAHAGEAERVKLCRASVVLVVKMRRVGSGDNERPRWEECPIVQGHVLQRLTRYRGWTVRQPL